VYEIDHGEVTFTGLVPDQVAPGTNATTPSIVIGDPAEQYGSFGARLSAQSNVMSKLQNKLTEYKKRVSQITVGQKPANGSSPNQPHQQNELTMMMSSTSLFSPPDSSTVRHVFSARKNPVAFSETMFQVPTFLHQFLYLVEKSIKTRFFDKMKHL